MSKCSTFPCRVEQHDICNITQGTKNVNTWKHVNNCCSPLLTTTPAHPTGLVLCRGRGREERKQALLFLYGRTTFTMTDGLRKNTPTKTGLCILSSFKPWPFLPRAQWALDSYQLFDLLGPHFQKTQVHTPVHGHPLLQCQHFECKLLGAEVSSLLGRVHTDGTS